MNPNIQPYLKSLTSCLNKVVQEGFTEEFEIKEEGILALRSRKLYAPDALEIINSFSFQGKSQPGEEAMLLILQSYDGLKGTLVVTGNQFHKIGPLQKAGKRM